MKCLRHDELYKCCFDEIVNICNAFETIAFMLWDHCANPYYYQHDVID